MKIRHGATPKAETDFDAMARGHLQRYGSGAWIDREAPILADLLRDAYEDGYVDGQRDMIDGGGP